MTGGGENRTLDSGSGKGRRKLRSEDFVVVRLGKDDEVMEGETDGSVIVWE